MIVAGGATLAGLCPAANAETACSSLNAVLGLGMVAEHEVYAALDWLVSTQQRVENGLARRHLKDGMLVLYDVSSSSRGAMPAGALRPQPRSALGPAADRLRPAVHAAGPAGGGPRRRSPPASSEARLFLASIRRMVRSIAHAFKTLSMNFESDSKPDPECCSSSSPRCPIRRAGQG